MTTTVFISYRRYERDTAILGRLKTFLDPLEREGLICGWTDRDIKSGEDWREKIEAALERAEIAVLLISQDFLASEFIREVELPRLLARKARGEITILPVFVSPANAPDEIVSLQGFARPDRTLAHMELAEQEEIFRELVGRIRELIKNPPVSEPPEQPASPTNTTTPPLTTPPPVTTSPILTLHLDCVDSALYVEALYPRPTRPHRTRLEDLHRALDNQDYDAFFRTLFESSFQLRELISATGGPPATDEPTAAPLRLRLHCTGLESATLPWHCITYNGRRLGEASWIVEIVSKPDGGSLTIALDNPLVVAPADPTLPIGARSHATNITAHIRRLVAKQTMVPWACTYRELEAALDQEPDFLYVFAQISNTDGLGLVLGKDVEHSEFYPLEQLIERLANFRSEPLVWLHLLPGDQADSLRTQLWHQLRPHTRLLLIQLTTLGKHITSLNTTLEWMGEMASAEAEPAAVLSRLGGHPDTYLWLGDRSIGLSRPRKDSDVALIAYIRASLIRLLLGRKSEKRQLNSGVRERPEGYLTFYGVCGDEQACVHDFPEQARHYLEELDRNTVVELRPLPLTMRVSVSHDEIVAQLMQDLNISHLMPAREALKHIPVVPPDREDNLIIILSWLLEPAADFTPDDLTGWLVAWKKGVLDVFDREQIPPEFRLLVGACIQWSEDWLKPDTDASVLQETIDRVLGRDNPRDYVYCIEMQRPLSLLRKTDLEDFYHDPELQQRLRAQDLQIDRLVDYILDKTKGRFQATVDLIYSEYKYGYADFRDFLRGCLKTNTLGSR